MRFMRLAALVGATPSSGLAVFISSSGFFMSGVVANALGDSRLASTMSVQDNQRFAVFSGSLTNLGLGTTTVYLLMGQGLSGAAARSAITSVTGQVLTAIGPFSFTWPVSYSNEVAYTFLCSNSYDGVSSLTGTGSTNTFWANDISVYTWKGGGSGDWEASGNWSASRTDGVGFPVHGATAAYTNGGAAIVTRLRSGNACDKFAVNSSGLDFTLRGIGTNRLLTLTGGLVSDVGADKKAVTNLSLVFDNVTVDNIQNTGFGGGSCRVTLTNGATIFANSGWLTRPETTVRVRAGCSISFLSGLSISGTNTTLELCDGACYVYQTSCKFPGTNTGPAHVVLRGSGAKFYCSSGCRGDVAAAPCSFDFEVPAGGYTNKVSGTLGGAPVWGGGRTFAESDSKTNIVLNILETSPAFAGAGGDFQLIAWSVKGVYTNNVIFGPVPNAVSNYFYYTYDSKTNRTGTTVTGIGVHIAKISPPAGYVIHTTGTDLIIPYDWATNACPGVFPANTAAMTNALVASGANGVLRWQSYALGLDSKDPASVVLGDARNDASVSSVTLFARNVNPATATGLSVRYVLEGSHDGATWTDLSRSDTNALSVSLPSGYLFFRVRAEILLGE